MGQPENSSEPQIGARCPACHKALLTRSARLCLFCGEKLPEELLLPLSKVHLEEKRSLENVNRVLNAYEARHGEIVERSRHLTHVSALFDDQIAEVFFPDVSPDKWVLHEFRRTLKLPQDDFDARGHKKKLDESVRKLAAKLATAFGRLECKFGADPSGHLNARLTDKTLSVFIETQCGKNAIFTGGTSNPFRSYSIRAEAKVLALNQADRAAQRLRIACMIIGIVGIPAAFFWLGYLFTKSLGLEMFHRLWLNEPGVTLALLFGAWVGGKSGQKVAAVIEQRTVSKAQTQGSLPRAESLWKALTEGIEDIARDYEVV